MNQESKSLADWLVQKGITLITFPLEAEYAVLRHVLTQLESDRVFLIHSKEPPQWVPSDIVLLDATGHSQAIRTTFIQKAISDDLQHFLENPSDSQEFMTRMRRMAKSHPKRNLWVWWSPTDMVAHSVSDIDLATTLRAISSEIAEKSFIAFVAKRVHSYQGLATLAFVSQVLIDVKERIDGDNEYVYQVKKHPNPEVQGAEVVIEG